MQCVFSCLTTKHVVAIYSIHDSCMVTRWVPIANKHMIASHIEGPNLPSSAAAEVEALASSRRLTQATLPEMAAACRGVTPHLSAVSA